MQLARYEESDLRIPNDETAIRYVKENINQIWKQPPVYMHGDFHPGNLIYTDDSSIGVNDFKCVVPNWYNKRAVNKIDLPH